MEQYYESHMEGNTALLPGPFLPGTEPDFSEFGMPFGGIDGERFMQILRNGEITTVFQPIVSLRDGSVLGYEALSRGPQDSIFESPANLFDFARIYDKLWELEFLCRLKALENVSNSASRFCVFLNVDPAIINDDKFRRGFTKEFLKKYDIDPEDVIFEITEKNSINDPASFKKAIDNYKEQGYKIAIDDTGSGYSGLKLITDIHPHYIKLDMNLIRNIDRDGLKYALIKTLYEFCMVTDIKVIAEGIETENELNTLIDMGINYGQGYLIGRPDAEAGGIDAQVAGHINDRNNKKNELYKSKPFTVFVGDISRSSPTVNSTYTGAAILDMINTNPIISGLPVVDHGRLSGLIMKDKFFSKLGTQYGFALFLNRPVSLVMDRRPLVVDYKMTIDAVAKLAMARSPETLYDYIIVTRDSGYCGIVTVKDLLEKTIQLEVNYAKHLNPLTGLPGNMMIDQKLKDLMSCCGEYTVLYVDIDNFKAYNDVYGFENGDRMINFMSRVLTESVAAECQHGSFIGHIGGDDFIVTVESHDVKMICDSIIRLFDKGVRSFYSDDDVLRKCITAKNRKGKFEKFNLATISIAGVSSLRKSFCNVFELTEFAGRVKKKCKDIPENCWLIE